MTENNDVSETILLGMDALTEGVNELNNKLSALIVAVQLQSRKNKE